MLTVPPLQIIAVAALVMDGGWLMVTVLVAEVAAQPPAAAMEFVTV